ncbi:MAG: hypothetical protein PGN27_04060 [Mycolicibacterium neoaurum]|uniref:hypothetical protein n=1 Tax=Mycolicibacterium neoaurum TaxID=1795 RepID=UPI002FF88B42
MADLVALSRPTLVCLLQSGDEIAIPVQVNGAGSVEYHRATITEVVDDEPNLRIRITFHISAIDHEGSKDESPGNLVHRLTAVSDGREPVYVAATDLWKWAGMTIDDPIDTGKVKIIAAVRGPHPQEGHEILALVVEEVNGNRKPVFMELNSGLFCEWG